MSQRNITTNKNSNAPRFIQLRRLILVLTMVVILLFTTNGTKKHRKFHLYKTTTRKYMYTKKVCMPAENTLRARHKSCFLRPDTGPCRSDIVQWYFDVIRNKCYRFYWGGCQGNGNRFETLMQCHNYCFLNTSWPTFTVPYYCSLGFDYGTCFGHFNRWGWDKMTRTCRRRLYSGCGGNQNNFESQAECLATCLAPRNNTLQRYREVTTCIPLHIADIQ